MDRLDDPPGDRERAERGEGSEGLPPERRWSDTMLVEAMRRNEAGSFREFFERFLPLITALARAGSIPGEDRDERVTEFLDDAALRLSLPAAPTPRSLAAYLAASFRRRTRNGVRDLRCRERLRNEYAADAGGGSERVMATAASENALRASRGPGWEDRPLAPAIERLALALERGLSVEDRQLLAWLAQRVPQREIASWLGITHGAVRARVVRLRARLSDAALRYAYRIDGADRADLDRFFRRLDMPIERAAAGAVSGATNGRDTRKEERER